MNFVVVWYLARGLLFLFTMLCVSRAFSDIAAREHSEYAYFVSDTITLVLGVFYFSRLCQKRGVDFRERIGLGPAIRIGQGNWSCYLAVATSLPLFFGVLFSAIGGQPDSVREGTRNILSSPFIVGSLHAMLLAPLMEEFVWRAFSYPIVKERLGVTWGVIVISGLFSVFHLSNFKQLPYAIWPIVLLYLFFFGAFLNVVYEREGNLKWCVLLHAIMNAVTMVSSVTITLLFG